MCETRRLQSKGTEGPATFLQAPSLAGQLQGPRRAR